MKGRVYLIGAGCGRGLISIDALKALRKCDVVVYDDLIDDGLLCEVREDAKKIYVGKRYSKHSSTQDEINEILYEEAKKGSLVGRLKGGDSFVFGRGGEEYLFLEERGINCDLFPGISSSVAVPEFFGIPVTHRASARSFTVVTGHSADGTSENFEALANLKGTLVFLMGINSIEEITQNLIKYGKNPDTPSSILSKGFSIDSKRIDGTLKDISSKASKDLTPGILVIGNTASFDMRSHKNLPLNGVKIATSGTLKYTSLLNEKLRDMGALVETIIKMKVVELPCDLPTDFKDFSYLVFTSSNGVDIFFKKFKRDHDLRELSNVRFACVGKATADALMEYGFRCDLMPERFNGEALALELTKTPNEGKVLIARGLKGSNAINNSLEGAKIPYLDLKIYDTVEEEILGLKEHDYDYIVLSSSSTTEAYFNKFNHTKSKNSKIICIGPSTQRKVLEYTDKNVYTAPKCSSTTITEMIAELEEKNKKE